MLSMSICPNRLYTHKSMDSVSLLYALIMLRYLGAVKLSLALTSHVDCAYLQSSPWPIVTQTSLLLLGLIKRGRDNLIWWGLSSLLMLRRLMRFFNCHFESVLEKGHSADWWVHLSCLKLHPWSIVKSNLIGKCNGRFFKCWILLHLTCRPCKILLLLQKWHNFPPQRGDSVWIMEQKAVFFTAGQLHLFFSS